MILLISVVIVIVILVHIVLPKQYHWPKDEALLRKIPGPATIPFLGTTAVLKVKSEKLMTTLMSMGKECGPIFRVDILGNTRIVITNPDDIEIIMNSKRYIRKSDDYTMLEPWLGTGLLTGTAEKWFSHRRILTPAFHFGILENYIEIFSRNAKVLVDVLKSNAGITVDINNRISMCTLDIICETAMGTMVNAQQGGEKDYVQSVLEMSGLFQIRQFSPWLYRDILFALSPTGRRQKELLRVLHGFTTKVIKERKKAFRESGKSSNGELENDTGAKVRNSFLDLLVEVSETEGKLTEEEIREEVDTFMFEGHDTTSAAISWALFAIGLDSEIQRKVHEELDNIFGDSDRDVTSADITEMKYLERVIKETMRLFPSVPLIGRRLEENVVLGGYEVPSGISVGLPILCIHRDPKLYPNPHEFDPDRFLPDRIAARHPYSYIPFSAGPRNCIGQKFAMMEEKVVLSEVLRHLTVTSITKRHEVWFMSELVLRPKDSIKMTFQLRK